MKNKKAVSIMIGYVLLIVGTITMSAIVYVWLQSYIPRETLECPDGVSLFVETSNCEYTESNWTLNLNIKNNGRFDIDGYYIKATINENHTIATEDISNNLTSGGKSPKDTGLVLFSGGNLSTGLTAPNMKYTLYQQIYSIDIIPFRYKVIEGKNRLVTCGDAKIKEKLNCSSP